MSGGSHDYILSGMTVVIPAKKHILNQSQSSSRSGSKATEKNGSKATLMNQ